MVGPIQAAVAAVDSILPAVAAAADSILPAVAAAVVVGPIQAAVAAADPIPLVVAAAVVVPTPQVVVPQASHLLFLLTAKLLLMKLLSISVLPVLELEFKSHLKILPSPPEL